MVLPRHERKLKELIQQSRNRGVQELIDFPAEESNLAREMENEGLIIIKTKNLSDICSVSLTAFGKSYFG